MQRRPCVGHGRCLQSLIQSEVYSTSTANECRTSRTLSRPSLQTQIPCTRSFRNLLPISASWACSLCFRVYLNRLADHPISHHPPNLATTLGQMGMRLESRFYGRRHNSKATLELQFPSSNSRHVWLRKRHDCEPQAPGIKPWHPNTIDTIRAMFKLMSAPAIYLL